MGAPQLENGNGGVAAEPRPARSAPDVAALAELALSLLDRGRAAGAAQLTLPDLKVEELDLDVTLSDPDNAELLQALDEFAHSEDAAIDNIRGTLGSSQLLVALRQPKSRRTAGGAAQFSVVMVTSRSGKRVLPLFSTTAALRAFRGERRMIGSPMPAARLFDVAVHVGFDALEFDRGSAHAWRLPRNKIEQLQRGLDARADYITQPVAVIDQAGGAAQ